MKKQRNFRTKPGIGDLIAWSGILGLVAFVVFQF